MLKHMTLKWRLGLGFGLLIVLLAVMAAMSLVRLRAFNRGVAHFAEVRVPKLIAAGAWVETLLQASRQMRDVLVLDDEKQITEVLRAVHQGTHTLGVLRQQIEPLL